MKVNNQLPKELLINKFSHDIIEEYEVDNSNTDWLNSMLQELEEELDEDETYPEGKIQFKAKITRKTNNFLGDHIVARCHIDASFHLPCGRCLYPIAQTMQMDLNAAYLHDSNQAKPEYAESTTVYADNAEMELYFYKKGIVNIEEFVHEQVFIEVNPFPRCEGECKNPVLF